MSENDTPKSNFITDIIDEHNESGRFEKRVHTRFPPEPNGYLHIGHAKSICLNFGLAEEFGGDCTLRFDDTNPIKEEQEYIDAIEEDVRWLGFKWDGQPCFASDYFETFYRYAVHLIKEGKAYVDDLSPDEIREYRGTLTAPGKPSPHRGRSIDENLDLFAKMRDGVFQNGEKCLRAKIDMASGNINLRDPVLYRILHAHHPRTGDAWCIYPMYDFAHGQGDAIEGVTHSLCTLEFQDHRPLYDWFIENLPVPSRPRQTEFARLNVTYMVLSKRKLIQLVKENHVSGWSDPRMPTIRGLRRRGVPAAALRNFCKLIGMTKSDKVIEYQMLEFCIREELNKSAQRRMAVLEPLKVTLTNYPEGETEWLDAVNNPEDPDGGSRTVPFSRTLYIEQADFMEDAPKKFFRLSIGREVRLRWASFITCTDMVKDADGNVIELLCTYDPATKGGDAPDGRKVKGTLHWVSADHAVDAEIRNYDHLYTRPDPGAEGDPMDDLNPDSLSIATAKLEPSLTDIPVGEAVQFERQGYYCVDPDSTTDKPVFNKTTGLRDSWAKAQKTG